MNSETKIPQSGEWWRANDGTENAFICGLDVNGNPVYQTDAVHDFQVMATFLEDWHHEPRCTGWDWQEPQPVDPGEGWELLENPIREIGDEWFDGNNWQKSNHQLSGLRPSEVAYRRKIKPSEVPAVKRVPVRLFHSIGFSGKEFHGKVYVADGPLINGDREILHDADGFYIEQ